MKVSKVTCYPVFSGWRKNWVFVKVDTDEGITGWGEAYSQYDRDTSVSAQVQELSRYVLGRDPFQIRHFTQTTYDDYAQRRGSLELWCAMSGIEQALWDIVGKAVEQPVYNLLGGPVRDRMRVYANGWSYKLEEPDDFVRAASAMVERGFTALKFDPLPRPWRSFIPSEHERHAERVVAAMRRELGPNIDFLIDMHRRLAPMHAIRLAERLAPYDLYWFEEPCPCEDVSALAEIRRHVSVPVVTGEALYTKAGFKPVFEHRAADIINPDVSNCGGILELVEIAAMAEAHAVAVSPHNYNSTALALSATVHAAARMPNFIITEYFVTIEEMSRHIAPNALVPRNGYLDLPTGPGLGVEIDEAAIAGTPAQRYAARTFRTIREEGP